VISVLTLASLGGFGYRQGQISWKGPCLWKRRARNEELVTLHINKSAEYKDKE
jgi:hypothetical protein